MNKESSIECNRCNQNKLCYMHVVGTNRSESTTRADNDWSHHQVNHSIVSLLERHSKWVCYNDIRIQFSNEFLTCIFYDLSLFTTLMTTAKMICTADRIERILYV